MCIYLIAIKYVSTKMKKYDVLQTACLDQVFSTLGNFSQTGQHLETFLVVTTGGRVLLASSGVEARVAGNTQHTGHPPLPPPQ